MNVAILAHSNVALFELACAAELFALPRPEFDNWYSTDVVSLEQNPFSCTGGVTLQCKVVSTLDDYDMLIVPSWPTQEFDSPSPFIQQLTKFYHSGKRMISFCSGAFLLAELGVFENRKATTHWRYADLFSQRFPNIEYSPNVLYEFDGVIGCSAGSAAGLDLGLAIIRQDFGYEIANQVAKRLVVSAHRQGGQAQFVESPILSVPNQFSKSLDWARKNIDKLIQVDDLANIANMSRRTFDRKFRSSFDMSPKQWLIQQKVERAKALLESKEMAIERLASHAGFENAVTMRHHFRKLVGVSPKVYRNQFCRES